MYKVLLCSLLFASIAFAEVFFREDFDEEWENRWVQSKFPDKQFGAFKLEKGKFFDDDQDKGVKTTQDAHFYGISTKFEDKKFTNEGKDLVIQFSVMHEQGIDCGGGYIKLFDCALDQKNLHGDSPYLIMFGPDICGPGIKKVHVIFNYKEKNLLNLKNIACKDDKDLHIYKLVVKPDNTYKVYIDGEEIEKGELKKDWNFLEPEKIKDPKAVKPEDWDDREKIPDPEDKKPEDWDQPEFIPDPAATKPKDWDDEMDGEWEPPNIQNPQFKGEWKPREIPNPEYKGVWIHPEIDNPAYVADDNLYKYNEVCGVGIDLWQVKSGSIFDNILIGDSEAEADEVAKPILERAKLAKEKREKDEEESRNKEKEAEETAKDEEVDKEEDLDQEEKEDKDKKHEEL